MPNRPITEHQANICHISTIFNVDKNVGTIQRVFIVLEPVSRLADKVPERLMLT